MEHTQDQITTTVDKSHIHLDTFSKLFRVAMFVKIFYGIVKITFALAFWKWATLADPAGFFYQLMAHEIIEDPNDILIRVVSPFIEHMSLDTTTFAIFYLLFWGIVDDVFLSINILRDRLWAFPLSLTLITLFVLYEIYRVLHTHSWVLTGVIVIDFTIFYLVAKEYQNVRKRQINI